MVQSDRLICVGSYFISLYCDVICYILLALLVTTSMLKSLRTILNILDVERKAFNLL